MRNRQFVIGAVLASTSLAGTAGAAIRNIAIANFSFETPVPYNQNAQTAQTFGDPAGIPGWIFQCDSNAGNNDRSAASYPNSNGALPGGDGTALAFFNNPAAGQQARAFSQDLPETIQPLTAYTLTVALGNLAGTAANAYQQPGDYRIQLLSDFHAEVAGLTVAGATIPDGSLVDYSVTFTSGTAASDPLVGHALLVQVSVTSTAAAEQSSFDNVRLTATDVPEPASLGMIALAGFAATRRRRRAV